MTSPYLISDIRGDEGLRLEAYPDPIHGWAVATIGYGHTGPEVHEGLTWTQDEADSALANDVGAVVRELDAEMPWWRNLDDIRQDVIAETAFNLGVASLKTFTTFLAYVEAGKYRRAALDMLGTLWARQVKGRARRLSLQLSTGVHQ
jgi:lysozyme